MHRLKITVLSLALAAAWTLPQAAPAGAAQVHTRSSLAAPSAGVRPLRIVTLANPRLRREVMGFVNSGNLGDPAVGYTSWDMSLLSTVVFFALQVNSGDGNLVMNNTGWYMFHSSTMTNFVNTAHAHGTRVIVSLNLHDFSTSPYNQVCTGLIPSNAQNTINQIVAQVAQAGIDGVNVDYEAQLVTCANGMTDRSEMVTFMQNLRAAMPHGYIAIDTYTGSAEDNLEFFDITSIAPSVDSFFVMAYDMDFSNYSEAPLSCTSYCFNPTSALNGYRFNATTSMAQYTALVPAGKVILGQPYYGRKGCVSQPDVAHQYYGDVHNYPMSSPYFVSPRYLDAVSAPTDPDVSHFQSHRDPIDGVSEWDIWYSSAFGCWREQYWDDVTSLGAKYDLVNADNLAGVGLFTLDYAGGSPEVWNELAIKFTTTTPWFSLGGIVTYGPRASSWGASRADAFVRGTDGGLWQETWNGTGWSSWGSLGGLLTAAPSAVSWGANRIDVFARGSNNGLWHRVWDGTSWGSWEPLGGVLTSGPAATALATNRLDVFMRGTDNGLWHAWWDGTRWSWQSLGGILTSDPTAVAWGPNHLDVFARGTDNGLWHLWWDGASGWSGWQSLGGLLTSGPATSSCSAGHLDVFATGTDAALYSIGYNGTAWGSWQRLGGYWASDPGAVCLTGTTTVNVFERGPDAALWHTNLTGS